MLKYCLFFLIANISNSILTIYIYARGLKVSKNIHADLISILVRASFTKFYNVTLSGRIKNRLSKDINVIDNSLPDDINYLQTSGFQLISSIIFFIIYGNPWHLPIIAGILLINIVIIKYYIKCIREITRLDAVSKSPILNTFSEIVRGLIYIRTCLSKADVTRKF